MVKPIWTPGRVWVKSVSPHCWHLPWVCQYEKFVRLYSDYFVMAAIPLYVRVGRCFYPWAIVGFKRLNVCNGKGFIDALSLVYTVIKQVAMPCS